jgi:hypothetical protein
MIVAVQAAECPIVAGHGSVTCQSAKRVARKNLAEGSVLTERYDENVIIVRNKLRHPQTLT